MRFGAFVAPYHRPDGRATDALARDVALAESLEGLGFDEIWWGEHHSGGWEIIGSPELMVAAAASRTSRIRLGTGVVSLPYHHPFMVADRIVQLDHLTRGRLLFGVGSGALPADARMIGLDPAARNETFGPALDAVLDLLGGRAPVTRRGAGWVLEGARLQLAPVQRPHPPLYVATSFAGSGLAEAARRDAGVLLLGVGRDAAPRFLDAQRTLARSGLHLDRSRLLVVLNLHVAPTRREAIDDIRTLATAEHYEYWSEIVGMPVPDYPRAEHLDRMLERGLIVAGSPGHAIDALRDLTDEFGAIGGILIAAREWAGAEATARHWRLFAQEVMPALRPRVAREVEPA